MFNPQLLTVISGFFGFVPAIYTFNINVYTSFTIFFVTIATIMQHLTENLNNYDAYLNILNIDEIFFVYIDRLLSVLLTIVLIKTRYKSMISNKNKICMSLVFLIVCDLNLISNPYIYSLLHSIWHLSIFTNIVIIHI